MKILLTVILILCQTTAFAQTKKFRWTTDLCEFEGTYDTKKYTAAQLENTVKLFYSEFSLNAIDPTPREFEKIKLLDVKILDAEYAAKSNALKRLNIVKNDYWETRRQARLKELEQVYQLSRATILGHTNPAKLNEVKFAGACAAKYANPLISGGDELLKIWLVVNEEGRRRNGDPARIERIFNEQFNSPERFQYAHIEVMTFGWWNCANGFIERDDNGGDVFEEFKKLFKRTKTIYCDEP